MSKLVQLKDSNGNVYPITYKKLLWYNDNFENIFNPQTITLNSSEYDELEIYFIRNNRSINGEEVVQKLSKGKELMAIYISQDTNEHPFLIRRYITNPTNLTLTFSNALFCYFNQTTPSTNNNMLIPYKIIGYKVNH